MGDEAHGQLQAAGMVNTGRFTAGGLWKLVLAPCVLRGPALSLHSYVPCSYLHLETNEQRKLCVGFWRKSPSFGGECSLRQQWTCVSLLGHRKEFAESSLLPSAPTHLCWVPWGLNHTQAVQEVPVPVPDPEARLYCAENSGMPGSAWPQSLQMWREG